MADCLSCNDGERSTYCAACGGSSSREALMSTAGCRGAFWAEAVAHQLASATTPWPPWPAWEASPRVRAIALRKIADLGGDERTRTVRARYCCESAARRYEELRLEVTAGARAF